MSTRLLSLFAASTVLAGSAALAADPAPVLVIDSPTPVLSGAPTGGKAWASPKCDSINGTDTVTFTRNDGATLAPTPGILSGTGYTYGLAVLQAPNTVDAVYGRTFYRSTNGGCRWSNIGVIPTASDGSPVILVASTDDRAYGFSDGRPDLVRLDGRKINTLKAPVGAIVGIGADRVDGNRARLGGDDGSIWETRDAGATWSFLGAAPVGPSPIVYRAAFDANDLDHVLVGVATGGAYVTFDGGLNWTVATGLSSIGTGPVNVFNAVIAKADGNVVWAMGLDIAELDAGAPSGGRHIFRSTNGGVSFAPVVDQSADVTLPNGPTMAAPPHTPDVLYFTFGTSFQGFGTDLYRYDNATHAVTKTHNDYDRMPAIDFNPADPTVVYLGVASEMIR